MNPSYKPMEKAAFSAACERGKPPGVPGAANGRVIAVATVKGKKSRPERFRASKSVTARNPPAGLVSNQRLSLVVPAVPVRTTVPPAAAAVSHRSDLIGRRCYSLELCDGHSLGAKCDERKKRDDRRQQKSPHEHFPQFPATGKNYHRPRAKTILRASRATLFRLFLWTVVLVPSQRPNSNPSCRIFPPVSLAWLPARRCAPSTPHSLRAPAAPSP